MHFVLPKDKRKKAKACLGQANIMDIKEFLNVFNQEGGTFEFLYPNSELEEEYINSLRTTWNVENKDLNKNMDLSNSKLSSKDKKLTPSFSKSFLENTITNMHLQKNIPY